MFTRQRQRRPPAEREEHENDSPENKARIHRHPPKAMVTRGLSEHTHTSYETSHSHRYAE